MQAIYRNQDPALQSLNTRIACLPIAITSHQFNLQVVQRIEIEKAMRDGTRERGIRLQPLYLPSDL